jgi:hypothetical protein
MLKIFWDKDNIVFISENLSAVSHSHCVLQIFFSFDEPLLITVVNTCISGKWRHC